MIDTTALPGNEPIAPDSSALVAVCVRLFSLGVSSRGRQRPGPPARRPRSQPDAGDLIPGTGGLRKVRWTTAGRGKRGGTRVIYFHVVAHSQIRMILIYRKGIKDDLSPSEKTTLRKINSEC